MDGAAIVAASVVILSYSEHLLVNAAHRYIYRECFRSSYLGVALAVVGGLVPLYVALAPLGTEASLGRLQRLALWGLCGALEFPMCYSAGVLTLYFTRSLGRPLVMATLAGTTLVMAAPCTAVTVIAYQLFHGGSTPPYHLLSIYAVTVATLAGITGLLYYIAVLRVQNRKDDSGREGPQHRFTPAAAVQEAVIRPAHPFFDRLPTKLGEDIVWLKVSGHYLEVATSSGSAVMVFSLAEASAVLSDIGMQIHRSYWVAYRHVTRVVRRNRRVFLCIGDRELPVSSSRLPAVREAFSHLLR